MAGIEQEYTKNARNKDLTNILQDQAQLSGEELKNTYREILKIFAEYEKSLNKQVDLSSNMLDLQGRYRNDRVALLAAENDVLARKTEQLEQAEYQLSLLKEEDAQYDKIKAKVEDLTKQTEATEKAINKVKADLEPEEEILARINEQEKTRNSLKKEAIKSLEDEIKVLEYKKRTGEITDAEKAKLEQSRFDLDRLKDNRQKGFADMFQSNFMKSVGGIVDAFKGFNEDEPLDEVIKRALEGTAMEREAQKNLEEDTAQKNKDEEKWAKLFNAVQNLGNALDKMVDSAAQFVGQTQGQLNAALYGYGVTDNYNAIYSDASSLTGGALLKQQDYLSAVKQMALQGIAEGGEVAALLTAVTEKTVPHYTATESYIRRLVLLNEKEATEKYFGLESLLQGALNKQFGESSYLNQLFDSVNSNLTDAIANLADATSVSQSYAFTSTVQEWLSTLYEQGVDAATVSKMASVLNALGSGNVSAMSSDSGMQKLALLAMDRSGQDYASILQNGLTAGQVDTLLASMVTYLKDVATSTNQNNVLESAYANLFGISMADMYALRNLDTSKFFSLGVGNTGTEALAETQNRLGMLGNSAYTPIAEQIENVLANIQFSFGNNIASNASDYIMWKGGKLAVDIGQAVSGMGAVGKAIGMGATGVGAAMMIAAGLESGIDVVTGLKDTMTAAVNPNSNSVLELYKGIVGTTVSSRNIEAGESSFKSLSSKTIEGAKSTEGKTRITAEDIESSMNEEDPAVTILKEFEETLMQNEEGKKAFAVSLQGMSNEVLKSFASIFADEDSMTDVFKSSDAKNKLFNYGEDKTTSNSATPKNPQSNSTTGSNNR